MFPRFLPPMLGSLDEEGGLATVPVVEVCIEIDDVVVTQAAGSDAVVSEAVASDASC